MLRASSPRRRRRRRRRCSASSKLSRESGGEIIIHASARKSRRSVRDGRKKERKCHQRGFRRSTEVHVHRCRENWFHRRDFLSIQRGQPFTTADGEGTENRGKPKIEEIERNMLRECWEKPKTRLFFPLN